MYFWFLAFYWFLLLVLSNDVETNPGPTPISGICRLCESTSVVQKDCLSMKFFIENYPEALGLIFMTQID